MVKTVWALQNGVNHSDFCLVICKSLCKRSQFLYNVTLYQTMGSTDIFEKVGKVCYPLLTIWSCFLLCKIFQMKRWESWEAETRTMEYRFSNGKFAIRTSNITLIATVTLTLSTNHLDPRRFQLIHQTSFGRRHLHFWSEYRPLRLLVSSCPKPHCHPL